MICPTWLSNFYVHVYIIGSFVIFAQSDVPRPRGVSLSKAPLYSPSQDFTCFDGTITVPFSYVNDDYCDCYDGSDEPGTSACLNGVFHCTNAGHRPQNLPSSRVNDGVCDCCDGTDEYATSSICRDTCAELGREARAEALRLAELHKEGSQLRQNLVAKGNSKRVEMAERLAQLEKDKTEAENLKIEKENLKNELEAKENEALKVYREAEEQERKRKAEEEEQKNIQEATDHFNRYDSNKDGVLTIDEVKVRNEFDKDKNGEVDEEEIKYFIQPDGGEPTNFDKDKFMSVTWPLLKPLLMMDQGMFKPETEENETEFEEDLGDKEHEDSEDLEPGEDNFGDDLPEDNVEDHEPHDASSKYDEETKKLVDQATEARKQLTDAERAVRELEANIKNIQENLEKDYGLQHEFATLEDQCYEYEDKEYVYKLCVFQKVTQKSKNGGSEVSLGKWGEWAGGEGNQYSKMKYTDGMGCWNGPNRLTTVNIHCGLETEILSVTEPFRCEYNMEFSTPAACSEAVAQHTSHDEL